MAIIGNIYKLEKQFSRESLNVVFDYLKQALDENSDVHKRIFSLETDSFEKVYLNDEIFAFEQVAFTQEREKCFIESHRKYIDFQLILEGVEQMEYVDIDKLKTNLSYDNTKDLITYKMVDNTSKLLLEQADLAIFFPDDGHIGLSMHKNPSIIHKAVVKLPIKLFK